MAPWLCRRHARVSSQSTRSVYVPQTAWRWEVWSCFICSASVDSCIRAYAPRIPRKFTLGHHCTHSWICSWTIPCVFIMWEYFASLVHCPLRSMLQFVSSCTGLRPWSMHAWGNPLQETVIDHSLEQFIQWVQGQHGLLLSHSSLNLSWLSGRAQKPEGLYGF